MKTLLQRIKPEYLDRISKPLAFNLSQKKTISALTIGEYIVLRSMFPELNYVPYGDLYGFCEILFIYEN